MGWKQTELEPALGTVVFLCSWSFIPISISVLMFSFNKYTDYIIHACMVAIILQILSLYLVLSRHQIALQYSSIRNRIMAGYSQSNNGGNLRFVSDSCHTTNQHRI